MSYRDPYKDLDDDGPVTVLLISFAFFVVLGMFSWLWKDMQCEAQWGDRGLWKVTTGCMVIQEDGTLIPSSNYRAME